MTSISLEEVRNYIFESNSIEEAERLLLDSLLRKDNERTTKFKSETAKNSPEKVTHQAKDREAWIDSLKISDLLDRIKTDEKKEIVDVKTKLEEVNKNQPPAAIPKKSGNSNTTYQDLMLERKMNDLKEQHLARIAQNQAYLQSVQRELDELTKSIQNRRHERLSLSEERVNHSDTEGERKSDRPIELTEIATLQEIGKKHNLMNINDMLDKYISTGSVLSEMKVSTQEVPAVEEKVVENVSKLEKVGLEVLTTKDNTGLDFQRRNVKKELEPIFSPANINEERQLPIRPRYIESVDADSVNDYAGPPNPYVLNRRRNQSLPLSQVSIDDWRRPRGMIDNSEPYQPMFPSRFGPLKNYGYFPEDPYQQPYQPPYQPPYAAPVKNPTPFADQMLSFMQQLAKETAWKPSDDAKGSISPSRGLSKPEYSLERDRQKSVSSQNNEAVSLNAEKPKNKAVTAKEDEIRNIQLELEKLKSLRELEALKADFEREKKRRVQTDAQDEWMETQKQELQKLRMEQVIAREKKFLLSESEVHSDTNPKTDIASINQDNEEKAFLKRQRTMSGVDYTPLPSLSASEKKRASGIAAIIDGALVPKELRNDSSIYRIALGFYDKNGSSLIRLAATSWIAWTDSGDLQCLPQHLVRHIDGRQMDKLTASSGARILVEIQCKDSEVGQQRNLGWGILPLGAESSEARDAISPGSHADESPTSAFAFDAWRIALRGGLSDPLFDALHAPTADLPQDTNYESGSSSGSLLKPEAWVLLRFVSGGALEQASSWQLPGSGVDTKVRCISFYQSLDREETSSTAMAMAPPLPRLPSRKEHEASPFDNHPATARSLPPATPLNPVSGHGMSARSPFQDPNGYISSRGSSRSGRNMTPLVKSQPSSVQKLDKLEESDGEDDHQIDAARPDKNQFWYMGNPLRPCSEKYQRGDGVDIYVDAARFLPDNCTVSRATIRLFTSEKQQVGPTYECFSLPSSPASSPLFKFKIESRQTSFNVTTFALVRLDTVDSSSLVPVSVGYSAFRIFCSRDRSRLSPGSEGVAYINTGNFQFPILAGRPQQKAGDFNESILSNLPRVPCASLLVRILIAQKSSDGITTLCRDDFPEDEWVRLGLDIPAPSYSSGEYYGSYCEPSAEEQLSFRAKSSGPASAASVEVAILQAMAAKPSHGLPSKPNSSGEKGSLEWFARFFPPSDQMRRVADLALAVPYSVEAGVIVSVECLHNMPEGGPGCASEGGQGGLALFNRRSDRQAAYLYKAIVSMHPPGLFYKEPPLFDSVFYTKTNNLDSPAKVPTFVGSKFEFHPPDMNSQYFLIIDVRVIIVEAPSVESKLKNPSTKRISRTQKTTTNPPSLISIEPSSSPKNYWALLPLSREHITGQGFKYSQTGLFQVPLIEGPVPYGDIFNSSNPYKEVQTRLKPKDKVAVNNKGKASSAAPLKLSDGLSAIIKVCNPLLSRVVNTTLNGTPSEEAGVIETLFMDHIVAVVGASPEKFRYYRSQGSSRTCKECISTALLESAALDTNDYLKQINDAFEEDTKLFNT